MEIRLTRLLPFLVFLAIALIFAFSSMLGLGNKEFLYIGDQFLRVSSSDALTDFFSLRKIESFGVHNSWQFIVQFWDYLFYLFTYAFGLSIKQVELLLFTFTSFFTLSLSYIAFKKIAFNFFNQDSITSACIVALFYTFNPYTFVLWHGGVYSVGSSFTYGLAPVLTYLLLKLFFITSTRYTVTVFYMCIFLAFFVFWMFAPLALYLSMCVVAFSVFNRNRKQSVKVIKDCLVMALPFILMLAFVLYALYSEFTSKTGYNDPFRSPAFGNQSGGLLYVFKLYFSWGIYNFWTPRTIYPEPVTDYFFSSYYLIGIILLYFACLLPLFYKLLTRRAGVGFKLYLFHFLLFLVFAFFAKADQAPLGEIFDWLYTNVPLFRVFRTSDVRFGFVIVLSISFLLLYAMSNFMKVTFVAVVISLGLLNYFFLTGEALVGYDIGNDYYNRVFYQTKDSNDAVRYVNKITTEDSYTLLIPPISYTTTYLEKDRFIGQDVLPRYLDNPIIYVSKDVTGLYHPTYEMLKSAIENSDIVKLQTLPISGVLVRQDVKCNTCMFDEIQNLVHIGFLDKKFSNNTYTYYATKTCAPLVQGVESYKLIMPTIIKVTGAGDKINLKQSYSPHWRYIDSSTSLTNLLFSKTTTGIKPEKDDTFMVFTLTPGKGDGFLVYLPQLIFIRLFSLSVLIWVVSLVFLVKNKSHV